jgi:myo-inositol-1(or 4)-monophosphatase
MTGPPAPAALAELARAVAEEAGDLLLRRRSGARTVETKTSPTDVVTEMDRAAEELIRRRILAARPGDAILGEEGGQTGGGAVRWIVDPLDGTVNYLYGLPDWSVSIAAEVDGTVTAGVVCAPLRRTAYVGTLGGGAWLHSGWEEAPRRLACTSGVPLASALVGTGFSYVAGQRAAQGLVVAQLLPRIRDIRRAGSAALDLCAVSAGLLDAFYEAGLHPWDGAAGGLIAREAGAEVGGLHGQPASDAMTLAAGPGLFSELHETLAALMAGDG